MTINPVLEVDQYPLPNPQDLFAELAGGKYFSKLDLSQAYQQMLLDEQSQTYLTINTMCGLFRYTRLAFGVANAPVMFQSAMDTVLRGLKGVICFLDDILISSSTPEEHLKRLELILRRLQNHGLRLRVNKCKFMQQSVEYLGYFIDGNGLHPTKGKVDAITNCKRPESLTELRSYLGMLQYYSKFLPDLSSTIHPLNNMLKKNLPWNWTIDCERAFRTSKEQLSSYNVLVHYDMNLPVRLACDASSYGLGAVISHVMPNGEERPIAYASRTLSASEKNYAQIEKEALSLIFGVTKFHNYLYGSKFTLITDHKPLTAILGPKTSIPTLAAARMQRWALILSAHQYEIEYRSSSQHANADALSRLPNMSVPAKSEEAGIYHVSIVDQVPIRARDIEKATRNDSVLSRALDYTRNGWPSHISNPGDLCPFLYRKNELSVEQGCLLWGARVIIPTQLRNCVLSELHEGHPGMCRMKALARSFIWWPGLDQHIEDIVRKCSTCAAVRNMPVVSPLHSWKYPTQV